MKKAWIENNTIFLTDDSNLQIPFEYIELDDSINIDDLYIDENNQIKIKNEDIKKKEVIDNIKNKLILYWKSKYNQTFKKYDYYDLSDVYIYSKYEDEANKLLKWYIDNDKKIYDYIDSLYELEYDEILDIYNNMEYIFTTIINDL